jgi:hypothetical protein
VRKGLIKKEVPLIVFFIFIISALTFGADKKLVKIQGMVMDLDLKKKTMIVNEMHFVWNDKTIINNEKGSLIAIEKIKPRSWVYIEGETDKVNNRVEARKIYLLPKYIDENERSRYSFMQ